MTLDLVKVAGYLPELMQRARREGALMQERRERALALLHEAARQPGQFEARIRAAESSWTLSLPYEAAIDARHPVPLAPAGYGVLAVDGSSIDVDRHLPLPCFVLNFGWIYIQYGNQPLSASDTSVELEPTSSELLLRDAADASRESSIAGQVLGVIRGVRELCRLAELTERFASPDRPLLALVDGNLALWNLDQRSLPAAIARDLQADSAAALARLRGLVEQRRVVFSGFVSRTGAANLVHSLRLLACPLEHVRCRACPGLGTNARPCDVAGLAGDAELMLGLLEPWERSAVFTPHHHPQSEMVERWYTAQGHEIAFFYLRTGDEIARIELPVWMAADEERLNLLHALLVRQAMLGGQYPVALQEAHEQAVISTQDRAYFAALLERESELQGIPWIISAKESSKRTRAI